MKIDGASRARWLSVFVALVAWSFSANASHSGLLATSESVAPDHIEGSTLVTAEKVIELILEVPELTVIDARIPSDRREGHIEGSVSLPNVKTDCNSLNNILNAQVTPVVFYCNGVKCKRSSESVKIALACGYNNIYWFRGGMEEWLEKQYPIEK